MGLLLLVYALASWVGALRGESDPLRPLGQLPAATGAAPAQLTGNWITLESPAEVDAALASARAAGQPLLLDFYADWCISCKVIEREVLPDPEVQRQLQGYRLIRFDMTASTPQQRSLLDRYRLFGPPALLLFDNTGSEHADLRVVGEIAAAELAARLQQANQRNAQTAE
jgi:thiol:disulfide interchange protein DsbD